MIRNAAIVILVLLPAIASTTGVPYPHPGFVVSPSAPLSFAGLYSTPAGALSFQTWGTAEGLPKCDGSWQGPSNTSIPYAGRRLALGWNASAGLIVSEIGDATALTHQEWGCSGAIGLATLHVCGSEFYGPEGTLDASSTTYVPRVLPVGWSDLDVATIGTASGTVQSQLVPQDARIAAMSVHYTGGAIPFTGRAYFRTTNPGEVTVHGSTVIMGYCVGEPVRSNGPLVFSPGSNLPVYVGLEWTSGVSPQNPVPFPPLPPFGDWQITPEGCNVVCDR